MAEQFNQNTRAKRIQTPLRPGPGAGSAALELSPKDIMAIIRRHVLLICSMTVLGLMAGGTSWFLLLKYSPEYTAQTYIQVLSPVDKDPLVIGYSPVAKDIQYGYRDIVSLCYFHFSF